MDCIARVQGNRKCSRKAFTDSDRCKQHRDQMDKLTSFLTRIGQQKAMQDPQTFKAIFDRQGADWILAQLAKLQQ